MQTAHLSRQNVQYSPSGKEGQDMKSESNPLTPSKGNPLPGSQYWFTA